METLLSKVIYAAAACLILFLLGMSAGADPSQSASVKPNPLKSSHAQLDRVHDAGLFAQNGQR